MIKAKSLRIPSLMLLRTNWLATEERLACQVTNLTVFLVSSDLALKPKLDYVQKYRYSVRDFIKRVRHEKGLIDDE